jgi:hypothetical protein
MTTTGTRSSSGIPSGDLLSKLPGTAIGSVETAMQLDLAVQAAKPLICEASSNSGRRSQLAAARRQH